jgi:signal transduction histidine kinase
MRAAYEAFISFCLMTETVGSIEDFADQYVSGYGTTIDEKIQDVSGLRKLVEKQIAQASEAVMQFKRHPVQERMFSSDTSALVVEEFEVSIDMNENKIGFLVRISTILELIDDKWKVVHWHSSTPVLSEDDTWHLIDYQKKNAELEIRISQKTADLEKSLLELKNTQEQLILQEKLASLGQLAAGIAHEIKNPMNFVNNFSELSMEYVSEIKTELSKLEQNATTAEIENLLGDVADNLKKIHQHGTRADGIVKSMLMHSRGGSGVMEPLDLNELVREYVNLAFHGMRAGKSAINVKIDLNLDQDLGKVDMNPEDFSRVILNLCKNAFDAMRDKDLSNNGAEYKAILRVSTKARGNTVLIEIEDNGPGVPDAIKNKLFQPFFTTKKGTEGTGLGLSITHGIIKNHNGEITIDSKENEYTRFVIVLPKTQKTS